ncbi:LysE family translocator [Microvirga sp. M2]|uniref:LysE family translocator n=1 Tax=Microvirga sp. M2 TaxID=3073270 RepID=UPI0039C210D9
MDNIGPYLPGLFAVYAGIAVAFTSPGPNFLAVVSRSVENRSNGIFTALGISFGTGVWALFAATGITALLNANKYAAYVLGALGGLYLCWLGIKSLKSVRQKSSLSIQETYMATSTERLKSLRDGLFIQLTNPKSAIFWLSVTSLAATPATPALIIFLLVAGCLTIAIAWHLLLALVFSSGPARNSYPSIKPMISFVFGFLFLGFGLRLVYNNFPGLY